MEGFRWTVRANYYAIAYFKKWLTQAKKSAVKNSRILGGFARAKPLPLTSRAHSNNISTLIDIFCRQTTQPNLTTQIAMRTCCKNPKTTTQITALAQILKVIAEPNRLKILCMLSVRTHCVCEIHKALRLSQNLTSHHLKVLRNCNLINCKKDGQWKHYSINKKVVRKYKLLLSKILTPQP
ncbi:MAG: metalloregulator ArsR/SmtB family transcription factor [Candidatus Gracilibacteria bacterium]|jgi:ArsR family transcriptional regulator